MLNSLRARGGSTHAREPSAAVVQLDGADLRGMGVGFRLLAPPAHGDLYQCVPPPPPSPPPLPLTEPPPPPSSLIDPPCRRNCIPEPTG